MLQCVTQCAPFSEQRRVFVAAAKTAAKPFLRSCVHSCALCTAVAGLNDTVFDVDNDKERAAWLGLEPNGFSFEGTDNDGLDYGLNRSAMLAIPSLLIGSQAPHM